MLRAITPREGHDVDNGQKIPSGPHPPIGQPTRDHHAQSLASAKKAAYLLTTYRTQDEPEEDDAGDSRRGSRRNDGSSHHTEWLPGFTTFRAKPEVSIGRGRGIETLRAEELGPEAAGTVLQRYVSSVRVTAPFFDAKRGDPVDKFVREAPRHPVFKLVASSSVRSPGR